MKVTIKICYRYKKNNTVTNPLLKKVTCNGNGVASNSLLPFSDKKKENGRKSCLEHASASTVYGVTSTCNVNSTYLRTRRSANNEKSFVKVRCVFPDADRNTFSTGTRETDSARLAYPYIE